MSEWGNSGTVELRIRRTDYRSVFSVLIFTFLQFLAEYVFICRIVWADKG